MIVDWSLGLLWRVQQNQHWGVVGGRPTDLGHSVGSLHRSGTVRVWGARDWPGLVLWNLHHHEPWYVLLLLIYKCHIAVNSESFEHYNNISTKYARWKFARKYTALITNLHLISLKNNWYWTIMNRTVYIVSVLLHCYIVIYLCDICVCVVKVTRVERSYRTTWSPCSDPSLWSSQTRAWFLRSFCSEKALATLGWVINSVYL